MAHLRLKAEALGEGGKLKLPGFRGEGFRDDFCVAQDPTFFFGFL